ncbi:antitoxin of toxin-antitoxin stability system [Bradyrhizobium septentrionale]|uniref:antitoxin of toxin-antitoxin stability system n=1 Tax=Bradyrhizobium septentrionale TaxID=1404411 RepID=UPI001596B597|nr:antitoxin of toxin-antitoxin stability system [Bradyrhizobium septentrionale]UGY23785.1 antitoxin of toxin-antitoxin stability system [Bradyrhizobium septentrionale]
MRTITIELFQFDELSDAAKVKARDWYREASAGDIDFADSIYEDASEIATRLGITFKLRTCQTVGGRTFTQPCIWWSGFSSQGDGACFEGGYGAPEAREGKEAWASLSALDRVKEYAPTDEVLHGIAGRLDALQAKCSQRLTAIITHRGNYYHALTMDVDAELLNADSEAIDIAEDDEKELRECFVAFANWIYRELEEENTYRNTDEYVDDTIRANEYEFHADGRRDRT